MNPFRWSPGRIAICILLVVVYLVAWRPLRNAITHKVVRPQLIEGLQNKEEGHPPYVMTDAGVALQISFTWRGNEINTRYQPQAGFFFLISLMTLVFVAQSPKWYILLSGLHLIATVLTAGIIIGSKNGWYVGFILVDLIGRYLVPAITLALAVWVVAKKKEAH